MKDICSCTVTLLTMTDKTNSLYPTHSITIPEAPLALGLYPTKYSLYPIYTDTIVQEWHYENHLYHCSVCPTNSLHPTHALTIPPYPTKHSLYPTYTRDD